MNVEELNTAVEDLRTKSSYISNTILELKSRGFVVNDSKYCKLRICQWLINLFNKYIFDEKESSIEEDNVYFEFLNHIKINE